MKILNGAEIAGYMKANQAHQVKSLRSRKVHPKLVIIRDSDAPVISKYVHLKQQYGEDIGVQVEDWLRSDVATAIAEANSNPSVHGMIVQLPLQNMDNIDEILQNIDPAKDVDGLATDIHHMNNAKNNYSSGDILPKASEPVFESATATAINWLLAGYDIALDRLKIALVGHGRLVGKPLERMWTSSGYDVTTFGRKNDLAELKNYDLIVSATGQPHLIKDAMVKPGAVIIDAGTASEGGVLVGDVDNSVRNRKDLTAITPKIGGVGPLTVTTLFEHVLMAANKIAEQRN